MEKTIRNMINQQNDDLIFLTSEKNEKISYGEFKIFNEKISRQLAAKDIINSDRAAIVLPNGPLMASSFLSISSYMSAAPLNPSYKQEEFEFYLDDLKPKFLLVEPNSKSLAVIAAKNLNIPVFETKISDNQPLGTFELFDKETNYKNLPPYIWNKVVAKIQCIIDKHNMQAYDNDYSHYIEMTLSSKLFRLYGI